MPTIHLVKDGQTLSGEQLTRSVEVQMDAALEQLEQRPWQHSPIPPSFNPDQKASDYASYRYVVLEIKKGETQEPFAEEGYYHFLGLDPKECIHMFGASRLQSD